MRFLVLRSDGGSGRYHEYELEPEPGLTVLDALFHIRDRQDGTLAFRYSCRGAVCGSCAMTINGIPRLACRTQVSRLQEEVNAHLIPFRLPMEKEPSREVIVIEPLPNLPVLRDLVVDMGPFFEKYRRMRPSLHAVQESGREGSMMDQLKVRELEAYTNCVLCACCTSACPVGRDDPDYIGPAALAKLYRFHVDPRDIGMDRLAQAGGPEGWAGCMFHRNCDRVCPKGVRPSQAIGKARSEMMRRMRR